MGTAFDTGGRSTQSRRKGIRRTAAALVVVLPLLAAACTGPTPAEPPLVELKRTEFGNRALAEADLIGVGAAQPVLEFTVETTPPSIFVNYVVPDAQAGAFESFIDLPPGFTLTKVRILESDPEPRYWLSLNVYRVSGITTGLRAEWSTYVDDGSGAPKFMIVRARTSEGSIDPIGPLALPEPFAHSVDAGGVIRTEMKRTEDHGFGPVLTADDLYTSTIALPAPPDRQLVVPSLEWVAANDFIYWMNGVNDRTFHNATAHSARLISVDLADVTLDDQTEWTPFIDPVPAHVLVYLDRIEFMIGPWWNITEPDGRVAEATRNELFALKQSMYGGLSTISALGVLSGSSEPIVQSSIEADEPATTWHWRIPDEQVGAFAAAAALPAGLTLAPVRLAADDPAADHWLTLTVHREAGYESGLRAEWSTYVSNGVDEQTHALILDVSADHQTLNPVDRFLAASPLEHSLAGSTLSTAVGTGPTSFASTIGVPPPGSATTVIPAREWVATTDLRYWSNGIADRVYSDSRSLGPVVSVDPNDVTVVDGGPWAAFTAAGPDRVWLDDSGTDLVVNPWWTLRG